jgi:hypothetical protein
MNRGGLIRHVKHVSIHMSNMCQFTCQTCVNSHVKHVSTHMSNMCQFTCQTCVNSHVKHVPIHMSNMCQFTWLGLWLTAVREGAATGAIEPRSIADPVRRIVSTACHNGVRDFLLCVLTSSPDSNRNRWVAHTGVLSNHVPGLSQHLKPHGRARGLETTLWGEYSLQPVVTA